MVAGVLVELSNKNIDRVFDYAIPSSLQNQIQVGIRVEVPFGHQLLEGFVLEIKEESNQDRKLKEVSGIIDREIVLSEELLSLGKQIQSMTLAPLISCYQVMLPKALKAKRGTVVTKKYDTYYHLSDLDLSNFSILPKQAQIIELCQNNKEVLKQDLVAISSSSLATLVKKNILIEEKKEHYRLTYSDSFSEKKPLTLEQTHVALEILNDSKGVSLIHGVTGSGKTEVYMELIEDTLKKGKTSIVLVPEISLTPQMVERFQKRFGNQIAAIHSALSEGEKYDEWRRISKGEANIVIGARSAIFAPLSNLGMIILDEEHSDSYKQDDSNPRYHALDVALLRGSFHHCSVVLGSATPSLETMARAKKGIYQLTSLPNRINGKSLPKVHIVDMNESMKKATGHFSLELIMAISNKLSKNEQVILLLNRRGYASFITCKNCGYTFKCPNCDITLTYHKTSHMLRCHYCGYGGCLVEACPECHETSIHDLGVGTEKIEEELKQLFPTSRILRMDIDTTSRKGMHQKMITDFENHSYDILLGTQMVAKGLDFNNVTLVGVINADTSLNIPDFRSSENTFCLLSQVAGRSGRSEKTGEVFLQTFNPSHYAIQYSKDHDYLGFYEKEMGLRKELKYPPFYYLCYLKISGKDKDYVAREASKIKRSLERNLEHTIILGPSPNALFKINQVFRYGIILKYKKEEQLPFLLEKILDHYKSDIKVKVDIDFSPSHF